MNESPMPIGLEKTEDRRLRINWSDGVEQLLSTRLLRDRCPCATCIDKRMGKETEEVKAQSGQLPVLSAAQARPLEISKMQPVGNYAYNIQFSDEHTSGIYTFDLLRSFGSDDSAT